MKNAEVAGQAHVKTGTLTGVRSIAGYVLDAQGNRAVVVFMVNHTNAFNAQAAQDAMLAWVHNRDSSNCCRRGTDLTAGASIKNKVTTVAISRRP